MSKALTEDELFEPTPAMRLWLDTAVRLMTSSIKEIARECKVSRQSWYLWLKNDDFTDWYQSQWNRRMKGLAWKLDAIGFQKAINHFNYWRVMQERVGNIDLGKSLAEEVKKPNYGKAYVLLPERETMEHELGIKPETSNDEVVEAQPL